MGNKQKQKKNYSAKGQGVYRRECVCSRYWPLINKIIAVLIITGGVYFVLSINDLSVKGFILEDLESRTIKLANENNNTELQIMELESYGNLQKRAVDMTMVKVDKIEYITLTNAAMAKK